MLCFGDEMKKQIRLFMPQVELAGSFEDILGRSDSEITAAERRKRWADWLRLARKDNCGAAKCWTDRSGCEGCKHLRGRWCTLVELPCTVNPYLTFRRGMVGMACQGAGYET